MPRRQAASAQGALDPALDDLLIAHLPPELLDGPYPVQHPATVGIRLPKGRERGLVRKQRRRFIHGRGRVRRKR